MIRNASTDATASIRCAIYTRKSSEEGLELDYNSLDAQRDSAEAYIASQAGEGWVCLPDRYDDGGFTGGNMERPALKRLLADIDAGKVDCVVVYKVDRLSRSLLDFARILEQFEKRSVSFVAVTQQINSASSMGRLMLNVLLSFAQFEREIISERTRDKIAAARRKGKWAGGHPVLGYDILSGPGGSRLLVNEDEAARLLQIFELYLEHEALMPTVAELNRRGWTTKAWTTKKGTERGGRPFDKNNLFKLLTNVVYLGKVTHGQNVYEGEHDAIVPAEIFDRVQKKLQRNGRTGGAEVRNKYGALLKGLLRCRSCSCSMTHTYSSKNGSTRYRYYVCMNAQKRGWHTCPTKSVPAGEIERFVVERIKAIGRDPQVLAATLDHTRRQGKESIERLNTEKASLERQLKRLGTKIRGLAIDAKDDQQASAHLASLNENLRVAEQRATEIREELLALNRELVDENHVQRALAAFDPVWDELSPKEQSRVLRLLIERVDYDGEHGSVAITFRPGGIMSLSDEQEVAA